MSFVNPILRDLMTADCTQAAAPALAVEPGGWLAAPVLRQVDESAPVLSLRDVSKLFPGRSGGPAASSVASVAALDHVDLDVPKGSILGVIGRSGAGKSTLIRLANGLERPTGGRILVDGEDVTAFDEARWRGLRRRIGMIFQHFNLLSSRTVRDNVALPLEIAGVPGAAIEAKVSALLDLVGLSDKRDRYPAELSGGQKQRVGIARALATDPALLLCDEATSALDPETTQSILDLLARVNRDLGVTILLITHEIPVIAQICDRVAVIEAGRIVEQGEVFEVFVRPRHPTTASFVRAVTGVDLPASIAARLLPPDQSGRHSVLRVTFTGDNATSPIVSRLSTVLGVDVNILAGRIGDIAGRPFGTLLVSVPAATSQVQAVLAALRTLSIEAEVIGHVA